MFLVWLFLHFRWSKKAQVSIFGEFHSYKCFSSFECFVMLFYHHREYPDTCWLVSILFESFSVWRTGWRFGKQAKIALANNFYWLSFSFLWSPNSITQLVSERVKDQSTLTIFLFEKATWSVALASHSFSMNQTTFTGRYAYLHTIDWIWNVPINGLPFIWP